MGEKNTPNLKGLFWVKTGRFSRFTKFYLIFFGSPQSTTELFAIFFYPASRQYKTHTPPRELLSFQNLWSIFLLLMEEILHHLACIKPYKEWATSTTVPSTGERRISEPSTVSHPNLPPKTKRKKIPRAPSTRALLTYPPPTCRPPPRRRSLPPFSWKLEVYGNETRRMAVCFVKGNLTNP